MIRPLRYGLTLLLLTAPIPLQVSAQSPLVQITNEQPRLGPNAWSIGAQPLLRVGGIGSGVEISSAQAAFRLSTGTLVVLESRRGHFRVLFIDARGATAGSAGRYGGGPGELTSVAGAFRLPGDSVYVYAADRQFVVFGPAGNMARSGVIAGTGSLTGSVRIGGGGLGLIRHEIGTPPADPLAEPTPTTAMVSALDAQQGATVEIGRFPGMLAFGLRPYPFSPTPLAAGGQGLLWIGNSGLDRIDAFNVRGQHVIAITTGIPARPVGGSDVRAYSAFVLDHMEGDRAADMGRWLRSVDFPDTMPRFADFHVDQGGNLWVLHYEPPWHAGPRRWSVFGASGHWLTTVAMPESMTPQPSYRGVFPQPRAWVLDIGDDYVVLLEHDEWGAEVISVYPLHRGTE